MPATKGNVVGLEFVQVFRVNSSGLSTGITPPEDVTNGDELVPLLVYEARAANIPTPQRVIANLTGGNRWLGSVTFGTNDVPEFDLTLSTLDSILTTLAGASAVDVTTNQKFRRFSSNENLSIPPQCGLILTTIYQSRDAGTDGDNQWINYIIPRAQITPGNAPMSYQAPGDAAYRVKPTMSVKEPHGLLYSAGNMGLAGNKCVMYCIVTTYPLFLATLVGDAAATTLTLPYLPASSVVTVNNTDNEMVLNGTVTALSSANVSTGVATFGAAPGAGVYGGVLYGAQYPIVASP